MLDLKGAHEWVVTTKLGSSDVRPGTTPTVTRNCRLYAGEMAMSAFVLCAAFYGVFTVNRWTFSIFLFLQVSPIIPSQVHLIFACCSCIAASMALACLSMTKTPSAHCLRLGCTRECCECSQAASGEQ